MISVFVSGVKWAFLCWMDFIFVLILISMLAVGLSPECTDLPVSEHVGVSVLEHSEFLVVGIVIVVEYWRRLSGSRQLDYSLALPKREVSRHVQARNSPQPKERLVDSSVDNSSWCPGFCMESWPVVWCSGY